MAGLVRKWGVPGFKSVKLPAHVGYPKFRKFKIPNPHRFPKFTGAGYLYRHGPGGHLLDAMKSCGPALQNQWSEMYPDTGKDNIVIHATGLVGRGNYLVLK